MLHFANLPCDNIPSPLATPNVLATDLPTPAHLLSCCLAKSCWPRLSWQDGGGVVAATASAGAALF